MRVGPVAVTLVAPEDAPFASTPLVFSALPHGVSGEWVARARAAGARVVDLSADLRLDLSVPYGLTEAARSAVKGADIVANPGCYATAVLLALWPLVARGLVASDATIAVAAASGVTGAGNGPRRDLLFAEVTEDYRAYAVGNTHRHLAEMRATLAGWGGNADLVFTPHLLPVARGILATITVPVTESLADPLALWAEHYAGETFVEIVRETPSLREVAHRNVARIAVAAAEGVRRPAVVITAAIDNLLKGAAGQAVQNGNLILGLAESAGLPI
jgi:N-acetyl-gamma-glutamyl-phosphate reductase